MLFSGRLCEIESSTMWQARRRELVRSLLLDFSRSFPSIVFRPELSIKVINAQAVIGSTGRQVVLYGGLALHPDIERDGLSLILLHEVGHHLSWGHRCRFDVRMACECEADHWSVTAGLRRVQPLNIQAAVEQLSMVVLEQLDTQDQAHQAKESSCWAGSWPTRAEAILQKRPCSNHCSLLEA